MIEKKSVGYTLCYIVNKRVCALGGGGGALLPVDTYCFGVIFDRDCKFVANLRVHNVLEHQTEYVDEVCMVV